METCYTGINQVATGARIRDIRKEKGLKVTDISSYMGFARCGLLREGQAVVPLLQPVGDGGPQDAAQGAVGHVRENGRVAPPQGTGVEGIERFDFLFQGLWQFFHRLIVPI